MISPVHCIRANGVNVTYVGTAAVVRDIVSLSDAIEGPEPCINHWGIRCVSMNQLLHVKFM